MSARPNILFVIADQERTWGWLPPSVSLPWRERLVHEGMALANHFTHSAPCSPSRSTMMTGLHLAEHRVVDNCIFSHHESLSTAIATIGSVLRDGGYRSSYIGKWHLTVGPTPPMEAYGYSDWEGNDQHFMGWAGTGVAFDPIIADNAADWLQQNAGAMRAAGLPWFLTVGLVNPHDVMWFPIDQPEWQESHREAYEATRSFLEAAKWKDDEPIPAYRREYPELVESLPESFGDDLHNKPDAHRAWRWDQQHGLWGYIDPADTKAWLRHLDYYIELHRLADESLGVVLSALDAVGVWDDTVIVFTSDHGDMCGSHGLRSKGPFVYDEIMKVPCVVRWPGVTDAGSSTQSLSSHVDVARTLCGIAGVAPDPAMRGVDLSPVLRSPSESVRDYVLFAHDTADSRTVQGTRYAIRGMYDGRYKYARYYGVGGGMAGDDPFLKRGGPKQFDVDADFDDQDHELYDLQEDPHELVNLANDRGRHADLRARFDSLRALESTEFA